MNGETIKNVIILTVAIGIVAGYGVWLDSGCSLGGAMTWDGKVCVETLK